MIKFKYNNKEVCILQKVIKYDCYEGNGLFVNNEFILFDHSFNLDEDCYEVTKFYAINIDTKDKGYKFAFINKQDRDDIIKLIENN